MMEGVRKCRLASLSHQHRTTKCKGTWTTCYLARLYQSYTELNNRLSRDPVSDFERINSLGAAETRERSISTFTKEAARSSESRVELTT
eukprot:scaffold13555_cov109-Alexandrium_tamarense.AAC.2